MREPITRVNYKIYEKKNYEILTMIFQLFHYVAERIRISHFLRRHYFLILPVLFIFILKRESNTYYIKSKYFLIIVLLSDNNLL